MHIIHLKDGLFVYQPGREKGEIRFCGHEDSFPEMLQLKGDFGAKELDG